MVTNFSHFHPVGVVLVAMLGIGVAEHTGFINTALRALLNVTPAIAANAHGHSGGYRQPLGGGRGLCAGDSAGRSYFLRRRTPSAGRNRSRFCRRFRWLLRQLRSLVLDPLLQGLSQAGAQILDPGVDAQSSEQLLFHYRVIAVDRRPGLVHYRPDRGATTANGTIDGDAEDLPEMHELLPDESARACAGLLLAMLLGLVLLFATALPGRFCLARLRRAT